MSCTYVCLYLSHASTSRVTNLRTFNYDGDKCKGNAVLFNKQISCECHNFYITDMSVNLWPEVLEFRRFCTHLRTFSGRAFHLLGLRDLTVLDSGLKMVCSHSSQSHLLQFLQNWYIEQVMRWNSGDKVRTSYQSRSTHKNRT